jgi:hypothetical protein
MEITFRCLDALTRGTFRAERHFSPRRMPSRHKSWSCMRLEKIACEDGCPLGREMDTGRIREQTLGRRGVVTIRVQTVAEPLLS